MQKIDEWSRRHYGDMPTSTLLHFALSGDAVDSDEWVIATTAYDRISDYVMAARVQMERIWSDLQTSRDMFDAATIRNDADDLPYTDWDAHRQGFQFQKLAFIDIHFYCWDNVRKMFRLLSGDVKKLETPRQAFNLHKATLDDFSDARHNLEHFDERQPGKRHASKAVSPPDSMVGGAGYLGYGNLEGGVYRFGARSWDVTPNSLAQLENIVAELDRGIRTETITMLVERQGGRP